MKKVLTLVLVAVLTIVGQAAIAQGNSNARSKRPEFVNEKHRAHAEWKREKAYAKHNKKYKKHDRDDDDRWERDDDRRRRDHDRDRDRRDDDRRVERDYPWGRTAEQRRAEERRREEEKRRVEERRRDDNNPRTVRDVILKRTGGN
ncbi:hypothetical protein [Pontibacter pudoricolor]|uniref:hypothetical protein n=1 Tax=Pontibacter pudoricolor TaxID=2694930 RepID=UPI001391FBC9|nr:hypothetical protein [Pontibacter pudoricolor]